MTTDDELNGLRKLATTIIDAAWIQAYGRLCAHPTADGPDFKAAGTPSEVIGVHRPGDTFEGA